MNASWSKLFNQHKKPPAGPVCEFCNSKFINAGALATHKRFAHHLEMHPDKGKKIEAMFSKLTSASGPSKKSSEADSAKSLPKPAPKTRKLRTNNQKLKLILAWEKLRNGEKARFLVHHSITRPMMLRYLKQKEDIAHACKKRVRHLTAPPPAIKFGFPEQREKLYKEIVSRRDLGLVVDGEFIQTRFKQILRADKPLGWKKAQASDNWKTSFLIQYELTSQVKTNKKSKSIEERLPAVKRFHQYTVYGAAYVLPSIFKN